MSQENVEIVRRSTAAYNRRDLDGMLGGLGARRRGGLVNARVFDAGVYRGHGEIRAFAEEFLGTWDEVRIEIVDGPVEVETAS